MNKDLRRKQKKAKRVARTVQRRARAAAKVQAPQFEPDLPMTEAAIEAEMERLLPQLVLEVPGAVHHDEHGRTIELSQTRLQLMRLQRQLFRVVFRREPGPNDVVFWDRNREADGAFPFDMGQMQRELSRALVKANIRPELAYAMALTGMILNEGNLDAYTPEDLEVWQAAVDDYVHQAETGVPPLVPEEFLFAWNTANAAVEQPNVIPIGMAGYKKTETNRILATLESELGTHEKAVAAFTRMAALVEIAERDEFKHLKTPGGYLEDAVIAAAGAEIDRKTGKFVMESFRERLEGLSLEI